MPSRMERYSKNHAHYTQEETRNRTNRNQELYKTIYQDSEYSNIEGIASLGNSNEIDISKIQMMLKNREDYKKQKQYRQIMHKEDPIEIPILEEPEEVRNYDIRDVLNKAKVDRRSDDKQRSLRNTQYNILKNLNVNEKPKSKKEPGGEELQDLIDTITSTSMLNQMNDQELSLNIFDDLKSTGDTTIAPSSSIRSVLKEEKEKEESTEDFDQSFFTSSLGFNENDFDDFQEMKHNMKKNNRLIKILIFLFLVILVTANMLLAMQYFNTH